MRWLPLLILFLLLILFPFFYKQPAERPAQTYTILDENLNIIARVNYLPENVKERVLIGVSQKGYVYVPGDSVYKPTFVDRFSYLLGREENASLPVEWWMEANGVRIDPFEGKASTYFTLVVKTPFEIVKSNLPVIPVYQPVFLGREVEANGDCIVVKRVENLVIPILIKGRAIVDPDVEIVCRPCREVYVEVNGRGYFSIGDGLRYYFFGEFNGGFWTCENDWVKVYVSGFYPWAGRVEKNISLKLKPLARGEKLEGNYIFLDITGALVSFGGGLFPSGVYRAFERFPLREKGKALPVVDFNEPVWLGYKQVRRAPIYSIVRKNDRYMYVLKGGPVEVNGLLCRNGSCVVTDGNHILLRFGNCTLWWSGVLLGMCPPLAVGGPAQGT